jgi:CheY-like chemotaxis protein
MDSFFEKLANSNPRGESSEHLKLLGKRAAGMFMRKEADSLTDAVGSVVSEEGLNKDQVRRITEVANQSTWKELFHDGGDIETHFEPANVQDVLESVAPKPDLVDGDLDSLDYYKDVPNQDSGDVDLAEAFGLKSDSPEYEALSRASDEVESAEKTASALDLARHGVDLILSDLQNKSEEFYQLVKQAHLRDDAGILQISRALSEVVQDATFAAEIMKSASARLQSEGVRISQKNELQKIAHPLVVNTEHPLIQTAVILEKLAYAYHTSVVAHADLSARNAAAKRILRDKLRGV